jgi:hypothetical protein
VGYRPMASSISSETVFFPTFRTKSEATTMPMSLLFLRTGSLLILFSDISLAASFSEASGPVVIRVLDIISESFVARGIFLATTLLTMSLSVTIPIGASPSVITKHPINLEVISSAASKTVLEALIEMTFFVMMSLTVGIISV